MDAPNLQEHAQAVLGEKNVKDDGRDEKPHRIQIRLPPAFEVLHCQKAGTQEEYRPVRQILPSRCSVSRSKVCDRKCRTVSVCESRNCSPQ